MLIYFSYYLPSISLEKNTILRGGQGGNGSRGDVYVRIPSPFSLFPSAFLPSSSKNELPSVDFCSRVYI